MSGVEPEEKFAALVDDLAGEPGVQPPQPSQGRLFGAATLKVNGKIFAMLAQGSLVVKLPAARVRELIAAETGGPFDAGKGKPMREWLTAAPEADWQNLAREALTFVRTKA